MFRKNALDDSTQLYIECDINMTTVDLNTSGQFKTIRNM